MSLNQYYTERIQFFKEEQAKTQKKETRLIFYRLISFVTAIVLFVFFFQLSLILAIAFFIAGLVLFGYVLNYHLKVTALRESFGYLAEINEKEKAGLHGDFHFFPNGSDFQDKDHPYSGDLDIFGKASLFQYLNRTTSNPGSNRLAEWLRKPASLAEIGKRQEAIAELNNFVDWRQKMIAIGYKYSNSSASPESILTWVNEKPILLNRPYLKAGINILTVFAILLIAGYFFGLPSIVVALIITLNFFVQYQFIQKITQVHEKVSKTAEMLKSYEATILLIEQGTFKSERLKELQKKIKQEAGLTASRRIRQLFKLVEKLDIRMNVMVSIPLNLFYFWDIRKVIKLERWKKENDQNIFQWFEAMAEFEALASLANAYHNNPDWNFPEIQPEHFKLEAEELGHPLIIPGKRVCNTIKIENKSKVILVTGSNMSGKSTFLRTCGVNIVLAMAGSPVCAKKFVVSHSTVFTSMRIADSLEDNTSSFYAELKRLASIIQAVERGEPVFLLLDEILRGTNSNDRHIGSVALIKQLLLNNAAAIIATHDLTLSSLEKEMPGKMDNYNFDVKIENEELYFDYKLNKGVCRSLNASILMKKMGIHV